MKLLPESFEKKGFLHRQEYRHENVAIYKRWKPDGKPGEVYPSSEQWGTSGWTFGSFEDARAKADLLKPRNL